MAFGRGVAAGFKDNEFPITRSARADIEELIVILVDEYVRLVRQKAEEARVAIRNVRRDELHRIDSMTKAGEVAEDDSKRGHTRLQKLVDTQIERVDALANRKEHEVLEV